MRLILILTALLTFQATNALEIDELLLKGEEGDGLTQYLLGRIYAEGVVGIERNKDVSESWYSKALATFEANQSQLDPKEQRSLAYIYGLELGGAKQNPSKVFDLLTSSARQNHMPSQLDLVSLYLGSSLAPRDISKAKFWALEIIKKRQEFAKEATLLMFQGYFQRIAWAYNQEDRILAGSYLSNFFGSSSPVFGAIALTRKSSSPFLPAILALVKEQVELQSRECRTQQLPDLYAEALMWMLIAHSLDAADTKYVSAFKDALSSSQITEGERLARLCIDSNFEMCGYETEANLIDYEIVSDIFAKDEKWIVSECFSKNKIFTRKLTNSSGYILQDFHEGLIDQEIGWLFDGTAQELRKFYQGLITDQVLQRKNLTRHRTFSVEGRVLTDTITEPFLKNGSVFEADGTLSSVITFRLIPMDIAARISKKYPDLKFEKHQEKYHQGDIIKRIVTFLPVDPRRVAKGRDQQILSEEYFTDKGRLSKKITYQQGRPYWEEAYNDDGSLDRKKRLR